MLFLSESDVRDLLPMRAAIDLLQAAFVSLARGEAINQPRRRLALPTRSVLHQMAASCGGYFGTKIYSTNPSHGAWFLFVLYEAETGRPLALMEANHLGQIRTGAASGLATRLLAPPDASTLALLGSGFQAAGQLEAMLAVRPFRSVRVWSRTLESARRFAAERAGRGVPIEAAATAREAIEGADVVVTATSAKDPLFEDAWLGERVHINAMGSNQATRREVPAGTVLRARPIVVDSLEQSKIESGDLLLARPPDAWDSLPLRELAELAVSPPADTGRGVTLFKSNGLALEDVAAGAYVYEQAVAAGRGREAGLFRS